MANTRDKKNNKMNNNEYKSKVSSIQILWEVQPLSGWRASRRVSYQLLGRNLFRLPNMNTSVTG